MGCSNEDLARVMGRIEGKLDAVIQHHGERIGSLEGRMLSAEQTGTRNSVVTSAATAIFTSTGVALIVSLAKAKLGV